MIGSFSFTDPKKLELKLMFVKDPVLRTNIVSTIQYAVFLTSLVENGGFPGAIKYMMYKNIIINIVSVIESITNYKLQELIASGRIANNKIVKMSYSYSTIAVLHKVDNSTIICGATKKAFHERINDNTIFVKLNHAARKAGLFTDQHLQNAEFLRDIRNKIHLAGIKEVDDRYSKEDLNEVFQIANNLIKRIESF